MIVTEVKVVKELKTIKEVEIVKEVKIVKLVLKLTWSDSSWRFACGDV